MADTKIGNKIEFDYNDKHYVLEYDRESVIRMESAGYKPGETELSPLTELNLLWAGAFAKNHLTGPNRVSDRRIVEILDNVKMDKFELREILRNMLAETYKSLMDENKQGNVELTVTL